MAVNNEQMYEGVMSRLQTVFTSVTTSAMNNIGDLSETNIYIYPYYPELIVSAMGEDPNTGERIVEVDAIRNLIYPNHVNNIGDDTINGETYNGDVSEYTNMEVFAKAIMEELEYQLTSAWQLNDLSDVNVSGAVDADYIFYDAILSTWVNKPLSEIYNYHNHDIRYYTQTQVNALISGISPSPGVTTFLALTDTPSLFDASYNVVVNSAGNALEFEGKTFLNLSDTPESYIAGYNLVVNGAGDAIELVSGSTPGIHASTHENGGTDQIDVTGLSGLLSDPQTPADHTIASHSDTTATGAELNTLTDGSDASSLHVHTSLYQPIDDTLTALAGISSSADNIILCTGSDTFSVGTITNAYIDEAAAISLSKLANINTSRLLGRGDAGSGSIEEMTISTDYGLTFTYGAGSLKINTPQDLQTTASPDFNNISASGNVTIDGTLIIGDLGDGGTNFVLTQDNGLVETREIDSRVWGSDLVDGDGTADRLVIWTDNDSISALGELSDYIAGTVDQIIVVDDGDGTITLSTPQNINTDSIVQFERIGLGTAADGTASLNLNNIPHLETAASILLVSDGGVIKYRTPSEILDTISATSGIGTTNKITKWVDGPNREIGDSSITDDNIEVTFSKSLNMEYQSILFGIEQAQIYEDGGNFIVSSSDPIVFKGDLLIQFEEDNVSLLFGSSTEAAIRYQNNDALLLERIGGASIHISDLGVFINSGDSGGVANTSADDLVVEPQSNTHVGMSVIAGNGYESKQFFGDVADTDYFQWIYSRTNELMTYSFGGTEIMRILKDGTNGEGTIFNSKPVYFTDTLADSTTKQARLRAYQEDAGEPEGFTLIYTNAYELFPGFQWNEMYIGGGDPDANAATVIKFYTSGDDAARTGELQMQISESSLTVMPPIYSQPGTSAAPTYTFTGFTDTGIYLKDDDNIGFVVQGNLAAEIEDDQDWRFYGDIYNNKGSYTPSVSGWSTATSAFSYKSVGKLVLVNYSISGTGNGVATQFTLPISYEMTASNVNSKVGAGGSGSSDVPSLHIVTNDNIAAISTIGALPGNVFGDGDVKWLCGQFIYEST